MWNEPSKQKLSKLPLLYSTEHVPLEDKLIHLHFFIGGCDWFIAEIDEDLDLMFRLAKQQAKGYRLASGRAIHLGGQSAARKWTGQEIDDVKELQAKECMQRHFPSWQVNFMVAIYRIVLRHQS